MHDFEGGATNAVVDPVWEWRNNGGASSIGGYVYRGSRIPALQGAYVFGDLSTLGIRLLLLQGDTVVGDRTVDLPVTSVVGFGEDSTGELFVLSYEGVVYRIDPA
jgi:hypothetical protein